MQYFKTNWPHLLLTLLASAFSTSFALGFAWQGLENRVSSAERQLDDIDKCHVAETRWQVEQNSAALLGLNVDTRRNETQVAQIYTRLGVIDAKLDAIAETLKQRP